MPPPAKTLRLRSLVGTLTIPPFVASLLVLVSFVSGSRLTDGVGSAGLSFAALLTVTVLGFALGAAARLPTRLALLVGHGCGALGVASFPMLIGGAWGVLFAAIGALYLAGSALVVASFQLATQAASP